MSSRVRIPLLLLAASFLLGCESKEGKELKKRPSRRESSAKIALPPGGTWSSAVMITASGSFERPRGGRGGIGSATYYFARTFLVLARSGGGEDELQIPAGTIENTEAKEVLELADRKWRLSAPSDGRGVAFAPEGVEEWRWVCCDVPEPFHCPHLLLEPKGGADPASIGPRWHDLVLDMLSPPSPKGAHPSGPDPYEWDAIALNMWREEAEPFVAAALREPPALMLANISPKGIAQVRTAIAPRGERRRPSDNFNSSWEATAEKLRASVLEALEAKASAGSIVASNAAVLLAEAHDEEGQRLMARQLVSEEWAPVSSVARDPQWPREVAWSLARSLSLTKALTGDIEPTLLAFLDRTGMKPDSAIPVVYVLVMSGTPGTLKKLAEMSAPDPDGGRKAKPDPAWPATLDELWETGVVNHGALVHPIDAWIRAALKAK
ncbi:MAG: hypothetical protein FD180_3800 [Planctomycetota bacterium]|nr:MAG: hypothetical protein FD180_3800 [Planctomycetota bacterium]